MYFGFTMNCYGFFYYYYFLMDATLIFTLVFHGFFGNIKYYKFNSKIFVMEFSECLKRCVAANKLSDKYEKTVKCSIYIL